MLEHGVRLLNPSHGHNSHVDQFYADEGNNEPAYAIDQKVASQHIGSAVGPIPHSIQRQRNERYDDKRIEDDG